MSYMDKIRQIRKDNDLSQEKLAEELDVSRQCVTKWEKGLCYPGVDNLLNLAQKFKVSLDWLFCDEISGTTNIDKTITNDGKIVELAHCILDTALDDENESNVNTGFCELDGFHNGLRRKEVYVLAGAPGIGKTAMALAIANNVSKTGNVLWFSYTDSKNEILKRLISLEAGVTIAYDINEYEEDERSRIISAAESLENRSLDIETSYDFSVEYLMDKAINYHKKLDLIVIDSVEQLVSTRTTVKDADIIRESIETIRKNCNCPIIITDRIVCKILNGSISTDENSLLRNADIFEGYSYNKWVVHRDNYYDKDKIRIDGKADVKVFMTTYPKLDDKANNTATLVYDCRTGAFVDMYDPEVYLQRKIEYAKKHGDIDSHLKEILSDKQEFGPLPADDCRVKLPAVCSEIAKEKFKDRILHVQVDRHIVTLILESKTRNQVWISEIVFRKNGSFSIFSATGDDCTGDFALRVQDVISEST